MLNWWKVNSARFPVLSSMVRDVLAVPMTLVVSESAFSTGERILSEFRSSLTPKSVQSLICAHDCMHPRGVPKPVIEEDFDKLTLIEAE